MYPNLSLLEIDNASQIARTWLANPYRVHQRLLMAYPDQNPGRVLFRIESDWRSPRLLVQSPQPAQWDRAFDSLNILAPVPQQKELTIGPTVGQQFRFYLRANPTKRLPTRNPELKSDGPRVSFYREEDQRAWLGRKGELSGFEIVDVRVTPRCEIVSHKNPTKYKQAIKHNVVDFDGILRVTRSNEFQDTLEQGIGSSKGFGFGLVSLASVGSYDIN